MEPKHKNNFSAVSCLHRDFSFTESKPFIQDHKAVIEFGFGLYTGLFCSGYGQCPHCFQEFAEWM